MGKKGVEEGGRFFVGKTERLNVGGGRGKEEKDLKRNLEIEETWKEVFVEGNRVEDEDRGG